MTLRQAQGDMGKTNYLQICFMKQNRGTTEHLITCPRKSVGKDNERLLLSKGLWLCAVARVVTRIDTAPLGGVGMRVILPQTHGIKSLNPISYANNISNFCFHFCH